jgi:hypothetical protein
MEKGEKGGHQNYMPSKLMESKLKIFFGKY